MSGPDFIGSHYEYEVRIAHVNYRNIGHITIATPDFESETIFARARAEDERKDSREVWKGFSENMCWAEFYRRPVVHIGNKSLSSIEETKNVSRRRFSGGNRAVLEGETELISEPYLFMENDGVNDLLIPLSKIETTQPTAYSRRWARQALEARTNQKPTFWDQIYTACVLDPSILRQE